MGKQKSLVEEAIIQMKNLEEAVAENAKGILASTMSQEIKELVKESLTEQEDEIETDVETDDEMETPEMDDEMGDEVDDTDNEDEMDEPIDMEEPMDMDEPIDLTNKSDEEVLRVFQLMGPEDNIMVTKDESGNINLKDGEKEYMIVGESEEDEMDMDKMEMYNMDEEDKSIDSIIEKVFSNGEDDFEDEDDFEEMDEEYGMDDTYTGGDAGMDESEIVYEIEFNESDEDDMEEEEDDEEMEDYFKDMMESKMKIKPKGVGMGSPKFKYNAKPNMTKGFKDTMKQGPKTMGTGKAKFEYKEGENMEGKMKPVKGVKKMETKESSRTLGAGTMFRKGGLPKPRAHSKFNTAIKESTDSQEFQILREKNEEYRKALNVFRNKLNEVAVFNSNLAYATRLFTEHSTSKQEKINILRRFDGVETIKESKNLYQSIKDSLSASASKPMNESVNRAIEKNVSTGSASNLIESKTYENPQFLRMKDLMTKIK